MEQDKNRLDDLFHQAKNEAPKVSFDEIKANFVSATSGGSSTGVTSKFAAFTNLKTLLIMIASVISAVTIISLMVTNNTKPKKHSENINTITPTVNSSKIIDSVSSPIEAHNKSINNYIKKVERLKADFPGKENIELSLAKKMIDNTPLNRLKVDKNNLSQNKKAFVVDTSYHFPTLTAEEIKENNKQKAKMIKQLTKFDKKQYAFIPSGTQSFNNKKISVEAFYMQTTEVTNLEYRTYLFDLLINNKKEEFLKVKPNQKMWVIEYEYAFNEPMKEHYFSHPAYDNYPVVAISREGAELYCKWLTEEANKLNAQKGKQLINDLRIPTDYEWMYAARGGKEKMPYPWGGPYLRNSKGCHLANYMPEKGNFKADGAFHTAEVTSYFPNNYGLYCMSGNVAEMIYYVDENKLAGTKGGSWTSEGQELQISDGVDRFKGIITPSVNIGFRPVVTHITTTKPLTLINEPSKNQNPPGTIQINSKLYMDATEITNISWREYVYYQKNTFGKNSDEYKNALPDTTVWDKLNKAYTKHYYQHPAYNNYPVVGISYEQAVAYCKWRTDRVKEVSKLKNENESFVYRLPTIEEWENVAKSGYSSINTKKDGDKHHFNLKRSKEDFKGVAGALNDNADVTAPATSYWPNDYGVYNIIGNVAEMVQDKGVAKGGSWKHSAEESTLTNQLSYTSPTNWLGFRCVFEIVE